MKWQLLLYSPMMFLVACQNQNLVNAGDDIRCIEIIKTNTSTLERKITNRDSILTIVDRLNTASRELAVFKTQQTIKIFYGNGNQLLILCNNNRVNVNGVSYVVKMHVDELLQN